MKTGEFYFLVLCTGYALFTFLCVCYAYVDMKRTKKEPK